MNIVQDITSQLGGETINKLSSLLGESPERVQTAAGAAVPTVLGALTRVASTPEGAQRLDNAVSQQPPGITSNFASTLGAAGGTGSNVLTNLLGGNMFSSLTSVLGRFTGMNTSSIGGLLGMISPLILGFLGKQKREEGLDAAGLSNFLNGQKQNIAAAMPSGLSNLLGNLPGFSGFGQKKTVEETAYAGASPGMAGTSGGRGASHEHPSTARWLIPLLIALAIIWALWSWSHRRQAAPVTGQPGTTTMENPAGNMSAAASQLTSGLKDTFNNAATTLSGVTDANSAQQATPQLSQLNDKLASMKDQYDKLPDSTKSTVGNSLQPTVAKLQQLSNHARGIPGVGDQFKSALDKLDSNLSDFGAPATHP